MGLLSRLGLKPTRAMLAAAGKGAPPGSPAESEHAPAKSAPAQAPGMKELVARFQAVMVRIKSLEAAKAPQAGALKKATIAAGNLSTSPKGIVQAHAALDQVEAQIEDAKRIFAESQAPKGSPSGGALPDAGKLASEARKRLKSIEARGRKAIAADAGNTNDGWLTEVVGSSESRIVELEQRGTQREIDDVRKQLDWLEGSIVRMEEDASGDRSGDEAPPDAGKQIDAAGKRLKSLAERGRKAIAADAGNTNAGWLNDVVADFEGRVADLASSATRRRLEDFRKQLDWLEESVVRFEADAPRDSPETPPAKPPAEESPALKKVKAQFRHVMTEVKKLADAKNPQAEALKAAAIAAGRLATSPKGIDKARLALDQVLSDVTTAAADAAKAKADAAKAEAEAAKAAAETFDITIGGQKRVGLHRDEAMQALRLEVGKLSAQLEGGWAYHVDQMNLPNEVPFQAWLTSGVDALKSFVKGEEAARIPDLNIWDAARDMMNEVKKAERKGDVKAVAALLPKIATAIPQARAKVGKYQEQMEGSAQTGVDAGRFVEDTSASAIGALAEKRGGKAGKIAAQAAAQGLFQGVEQLTEWMIGSRQHADPGAIAMKMGEEAVGAIFKELVAGQLKGPFKSAFGSYLGKGVDDATLKAMDLSRDAFMTGTQKYLAELAAKQSAGLIKSAITKVVAGKLPDSPQAMVEAIAGELTKGSSKQLIVDAIKEIAKAAVTAK
jgi:hypothetical protein